MATAVLSLDRSIGRAVRGMLHEVLLIGADNVWSAVEISENATVRDVATDKYHLFWRTTKKNGTSVLPYHKSCGR